MAFGGNLLLVSSTKDESILIRRFLGDGRTIAQKVAVTAYQRCNDEIVWGTAVSKSHSGTTTAVTRNEPYTASHRQHCKFRYARGAGNRTDGRQPGVLKLRYGAWKKCVTRCTSPILHTCTKHCTND